ncbi:MAG: Alpha/beta hydrolase fold-3 domain protein [Blastococcus sp.]|jgi:cation diffusion facilitator CzcD-associated flavoprotein CzcO|nr:Alpha/beta hydrolase fold-3 domain protein [Blastococcus sp.]
MTSVAIVGTGFAATTFLLPMPMPIPMPVTGGGGRDLHEGRAEGASAYLGAVVPGFPDFTLVYGPNTDRGHHAIIVMIEAQVGAIVQAVRQLRWGRFRRRAGATP